MADEQKNQLEEMSMWDHVDALRAVLIKMVIVLAVVACVLFVLMPDIFDNVILAPCRGDFVLYRLFEHITAGIPSLPQFTTEGFEVKLINIQLASQFFIHMSTSFWLALVLTFPVLIYLLWTFVSPALYPEEKKGFKKAFAIGNVMFWLGVLVGYFLVFPITLRFLADYHVSEMIPNQISLDSYMDTFLMLIFIMGIVFEMPLLTWVLGGMKILHREFFKKFRRHAIVILLILAAIITPTGDPFTLMIVFLPIYLLYELSAFLVKPAPVAENEEDTTE
ncbi:MAG: twin-arginine translocase subunit TatC [Muribaculaceae bacterium]|nr:twin-arginine translocase subunit TatC [Muribaculaceae bacterium]